MLNQTQLVAGASKKISGESHWRVDACKVGCLEPGPVANLTLLDRDIKSYQDVINSFSIVALRERFDFLRQLGNVFLVRPETIKSYISENQLGRIDINLLKPYLALRSDWTQFEKAFNEAEGLTDENSSSSEGRGFKERFGRLSVMMKDLENVKLSDNIPVGMPSIPTSINIPTSITNSFTITRTFSG
jgi:hypothetical protein